MAAGSCWAGWTVRLIPDHVVISRVTFTLVRERATHSATKWSGKLLACVARETENFEEITVGKVHRKDFVLALFIFSGACC